MELDTLVTVMTIRGNFVGKLKQREGDKVVLHEPLGIAAVPTSADQISLKPRLVDDIDLPDEVEFYIQGIFQTGSEVKKHYEKMIADVQRHRVKINSGLVMADKMPDVDPKKPNPFKEVK